MDRETYISQIEAAISSMHAANKTISNSYGSRLGLLELATLSELLNNSEISSEEIAIRTHSSAVKISRCIKSLGKAGLLTKGIRNKTLKLIVTKDGVHFFKEAYRIECLVFAKAFRRLPQEFHEIFKIGLSSLNKGLRANSAVHIKEDPIFLPEIRRLTRALGFLSGSPYNFQELSSLEWHILRAFYAAHIESKSLNAKVLELRFAIPIQTIFSALKRMEKLSLLQQLPSLDRREKVLVLSKKGELQMERCLNHAKSIIDTALSSLDLIQLRSFSQACLFYSGLEQGGEELSVGPSVTIKLARTKKDIGLARKLIYKARVFCNSLENLPETICSLKATVGIICQHNVAQAVIEVKNGRLLNFVCIPGTISKNNLRKCFEIFIKHSMQIQAHQIPATTSACTPECFSAIKNLFIQNKNQN